MSHKLRDKITRELWQKIFAHVKGQWFDTEKFMHDEIREIISAALDEYAEGFKAELFRTQEAVAKISELEAKLVVVQRPVDDEFACSACGGSGLVTDEAARMADDG